MNTFNPWWSEISLSFLDETITHVNTAGSRRDPVGHCDDLCKALNKLFNAHYLYRHRTGALTETERDETKGRSDSQAFAQLLLTGMSYDQQKEFVQCLSIRRLAEFEPQIMSHATLLAAAYDPTNISDALRKKASVAHKGMLNAFRRTTGKPDDRDLLHAFLRKMAAVAFIVRSNIAHSEKTPRGPDLEKVRRDRAISEITADVLHDLFDILFDHPYRRLAVYGTLAPGKPNASVLADIDGQWLEGTVYGDVSEADGFPVYHWRRPGSSVPVKILDAPTLPDHFDRLDSFEGTRYRRILLPVEMQSGLSVCNIYAGSEAIDA